MSTKAKKTLLFVSLWLLSVGILSWVLIEVRGAEKVFNWLIILAFLFGGFFVLRGTNKYRLGGENVGNGFWLLGAMLIFGGIGLIFHILAKSSHSQSIWDEELAKSSYTLVLETTTKVFYALFLLSSLASIFAFHISPANEKTKDPSPEPE